ncbi:unnamed protein product [Ostreobium quekettii]|uniref:Uncharacterized protein n=1 Tax=Ostreobium quekettii TaxID=121088 RepID=A0A8S1IZK9_9CHLO|nr:unnamed protein product [Ostreobium quekettii]
MSLQEISAWCSFPIVLQCSGDLRGSDGVFLCVVSLSQSTCLFSGPEQIHPTADNLSADHLGFGHTDKGTFSVGSCFQLRLSQIVRCFTLMYIMQRASFPQ